MPIISRYLARQVAIAVALTLLLVSSLVWALQAMRLGHHLAGSGLGATGLALVLAYTLPTVAVFALPLATVGAILLVYTRLHATGEIEAMAACGIAPRRLAQGPALVVVASAVLALVSSAVFEGPALGRLELLLSGAVARAAIHRIAADTFHRLDADTTLRVGRVENGPENSLKLARVVVASQHPDRLLLATSGSLELTRRGQVRLELRDGEVHQPLGQQRALRARFRQLRVPLGLGQRFERHFGFLTQSTARRTPVAAATACLALGLLTLGILGWLRRPTACLVAVVALIAAYQALLWLGQTLGTGEDPAMVINCVLAGGAAAWVLVRGR